MGEIDLRNLAESVWLIGFSERALAAQPAANLGNISERSTDRLGVDASRLKVRVQRSLHSLFAGE